MVVFSGCAVKDTSSWGNDYELECSIVSVVLSGLLYLTTPPGGETPSTPSDSLIWVSFRVIRPLRAPIQIGHGSRASGFTPKPIGGCSQRPRLPSLRSCSSSTTPAGAGHRDQRLRRRCRRPGCLTRLNEQQQHPDSPIPPLRLPDDEATPVAELDINADTIDPWSSYPAHFPSSIPLPFHYM